MNHKPMILYYDNGQKEKHNALAKAVKCMGISIVPILPSHFHQTVGYLAKIKGFPARKISPLEIQPVISSELMILCDFTEVQLDTLLIGMKNGRIPHVPLKAVLTAQNSFWTLVQLFQELEEEHQSFYSE